MQNENRTYRIIKREFYRIFERKTLYLLMILLPIVLFTLYGLIYKSESVTEIPIAIVDNDNSQLSRTITQFVESSSALRIEKYFNSIDEVKSAIRKGEIQGAFYIPSDLEKDVKHEKSSSVVIYKNTSNLVIGNSILKDGTQIIRTVSGGILLKKLMSDNMLEDQAMNIVNPIKIESMSLYNPNYSYLSYLIPGLIGFTIQMLIMVASVLVISSEFTHHTFHELVELADKKVSRILIGKFTPHFIIHFATVLIITGVIFPLFNIRVYGSELSIIALFTLFITVSLLLGLMISSLFHDQLFATELALFINTPAFIFSGFTFPLWGMPALHSTYAQLIPFTHFLSAFLKVYQMGTPLSSALDEILILCLFAGVSLIVLFIKMKIEVNKTGLIGKTYSTKNELQIENR